MNYKRLTLLFVGLIGFNFCLHAQKASQVLENGIRVKGDRNIFVKYNPIDKTIWYDLDRSTENTNHPLNFNNPLADSIIFLPGQGGVNVYLMPLNPLNYGYNTNLNVIDDPIAKEADKVMGEILDGLGKVITPSLPAPAAAAAINPCDTILEASKLRVKAITELLDDSKKDKIVAIFKRLKALTFIEEQTTRDSLDAIHSSISTINEHFKKVTAAIEHAKERISKLDSASCWLSHVNISIVNNSLKDLLAVQADQEKRHQKLKVAYNLANKTYQRASIGGGLGLSWCIPLTNIPVKKGKISLYTIKIQESGYQLSDKDEIVETPAKDIITRTLRIRRYDFFVPERAVGIAYTAFTYNTYGTTTDPVTGEQVVAEPTENAINNINVSTMINFNIFLERTMIHPMIQLGLGVNANIPTLLGGVGIRSNINGTRRLAISTGFAATWVRELDQLKVGDTVTGTDDIEDDLKYNFSLPIKPYFGIQFNF